MQVRPLMAMLRDLFQTLLYFAMSNRKWHEWYKLSFVSILNKASLGFATIALALFQSYYFYHDFNKNIDGWLNTLSALINVGLTSFVSYAELFAALMGLSFTASVWIFAVGLGVSMVNQLLNCGINYYRSLVSSGDIQSKHYQQAAFQNAFGATYFALTISSLLYSSTVVANPLLLTTLCLSVVACGLVAMAWRSSSLETRAVIKQRIDLVRHQPRQKEYYPSLFVAPLYIEKIKYLKNFEERRRELLIDLNLKLKRLQEISPKPPSVAEKINLLSFMIKSLKESNPMPVKEEIAQTYPNVFQSFWRDKGGVEQLFDAVAYCLDNRGDCEHDKENSRQFHA